MNKVIVKDSIFTENYCRLSNALFLHGFNNILLDNLTISKNGVIHNHKLLDIMTKGKVISYPED